MSGGVEWERWAWPAPTAPPVGVSPPAGGEEYTRVPFLRFLAVKPGLTCLRLLQAPPSSCQSAGCHGYCCLLSPAASGCGDPGGARLPFDVLFLHLRFGNNGNIPILRRRAMFLNFLESRGAFGTDPVSQNFTSCLQQGIVGILSC